MVKSHLMNDVHLGCSFPAVWIAAIITVLSIKIIGKSTHSFSVGIDGNPDLEAAKMLSCYLDTIHLEYLITVEEVMEKLLQINHYLESFDQRSCAKCNSHLLYGRVGAGTCQGSIFLV